MASFLDKISSSGANRCQGLVFVITGAVNSFENRNEFVTYVVSQGGKVSGSVTAKTDYLVNNDIDSTSTKNRKAKELGVPIITEDEFIKRFAYAGQGIETPVPEQVSVSTNKEELICTKDEEPTRTSLEADAIEAYKAKMLAKMTRVSAEVNKNESATDPLLSTLEKYYPEHKVFALDGIDGGLRARLSKRAKELGYINTDEYLKSYGFETISTEEAKQLRSKVIYPPGEEPEIIKSKIISVLRRLDEKYPDRLLPVTLQTDNKSLAGDLSGLYQWMGYQNYWAFLKAYGYQVDCIQTAALQSIIRKLGPATRNNEDSMMDALMALSFMDIRLDRFGQVYIARALTCDPEVVIPAGIDCISSSAFANQRDLRKVTICAQLKSIPDKAFFNCESLESVVLPESVTSILSDAFANCTVLQNIDLSNEDIDIDASAFRGTPQEEKVLALILEKEARMARMKAEEEKKKLEEERLRQEQRATEVKAKMEASIRKQIEAELKVKTTEIKRKEKELNKLAEKEERRSAIMERRLARLEQFYPEHKIFAFDSLVSDLRDALSAESGKEGYATLEEYLNEYGYEMISGDDVQVLRNAVIYTPGNEPDFIKSKVESAIRRLEEYYPDHTITGALQNEHKNLSKDISGLYQWFGYKNAEEMLNAYGFTYTVKDSGRPANDYASLVDTLIERYKDKEKPKNMGQLLFDNQDLKGPLKTLANKSGELFGMTLKKYFDQLGLFREKASPEKAARNDAEDTLRALYATLDAAEHGTIDSALASLDGMNVKQNKSRGIYIFRALDCGSDVTIPYGVDQISSGAFQGNSSLKNLEIRAALEEIPEDAFSGCISLERVVLPASLQKVAKNAFSGCSALKDVVLQNEFTYVEPGAFSDCPFEYIPGKSEDATDEEYFTVSCNRKGQATITGIAGLSFDLEKLIIPKFIKGCIVTAIGDNAFAGCRNLVEVMMPDTITSLMRGAFKDCIRLKKVHLSDSIEKLITTSFSGCIGLQEINIPDMVTELKKGTFRDSPIKTLHIGKNLKTIDTMPFSNGERDEYTGKIISTRAIQSITIDAFNPYLSAHGSIVTTKDGETVLAALGNERAMQVPDGVIEIAAHAFEKLAFLTDITLPESLIEIGENAFAATGLRRVQISQNVSRIKARAFKYCEHLTSVIFNDSLKEIGEEAFYRSPVATVKLPPTLQILGDNCFDCFSEYYGSISQKLEIDSSNPFITADGSALYILRGEEKVLQRLYGPKYRSYDYDNLFTYVVEEGTDRIESGAFYYCNRLEKVVLPEGLTSIGDNAFYGCDSLADIELPDSLISIGQNAFYGTAVDELHIGPNVEEIGFGAFIGKYSSMFSSSYANDMDLFVDENNSTFFTDKGVLYKRIEGGTVALAPNNNASAIILRTDTVEIAKEAFKHGVMEEVLIPSSVRKIGEDAFSGCSNLIRLRLGVADQDDSLNTAVVYIPGIDSQEYWAESPHDQYMDCIRIDGDGTLFDFVKYDSLFPTIEEEKDKTLVAIDRLKSAHQLVPLYRDAYLTYLQKKPEQAVRIVIEYDDLDGLSTLSDLGVFTGKNIDKLIELANKAGNVGVIGYLMNYKNEEFGVSVEDEFKL